jgi:hypothetical protein
VVFFFSPSFFSPSFSPSLFFLPLKLFQVVRLDTPFI